MDVNGEVKIQKKNNFFLGGWGGGVGLGGQGGCEWRSEAIVKIIILFFLEWGGGGLGGSGWM